MMVVRAMSITSGVALDREKEENEEDPVTCLGVGHTEDWTVDQPESRPRREECTLNLNISSFWSKFSVFRCVVARRTCINMYLLGRKLRFFSALPCEARYFP
jgi:hypothetical protein